MASTFKKVIDPVTGKATFVNTSTPTTSAPENKEAKDPSKKYCHDCNKAIMDHMISAGGHNYHPSCFACCKCNKEFEMNALRYTIDDNGKPWCANCIAFADKAAGVHKDRKFNDAKSHDTDVTRAITQMAMLGGDRPVYGGGSTSLADAITGKSKATEATFCVGCKTAINGPCMNTSKGAFHDKCFSCYSCKKAIPTDEGHMFVGDHVYHSDCGKKATAGLCDVCHEAATGRCYTVKGAKIHPACFLCAVCKKDLTAGHLAADGRYFCSSSCKASGTGASTSSSSSGGGGGGGVSAAGPFAGQRCCGSCGSFNPAVAKFCAECGATI